MTMFYIWDTRSRDDNALFWRHQGAGYTTNLDDAGIYTAEQIAARCLEWHQVAVPCEEVDTEAHRAVKVRKMRDPPEEPAHLKAEREAWRKQRESEEAAFALEGGPKPCGRCEWTHAPGTICPVGKPGVPK